MLSSFLSLFFSLTALFAKARLSVGTFFCFSLVSFLSKYLFFLFDFYLFN